MKNLIDLINKYKNQYSIYALLELVEHYFSKSIEKISIDNLVIKGSVNVSSPPSELNKVTLSGEQLSLSFNNVGIVGIQGPMDMELTEQVIRSMQSGDHAFRDLIDIFNHRLVQNLYRSYKSLHLTYFEDEDIESIFDIFCDKIYSSFTLENEIRRIFREKAKIAIKKAQPRWLQVEKDDRLSMNCILKNKLLGKRILVNDNVEIHLTCKNIKPDETHLRSIINKYCKHYTLSIISAHRIVLNHCRLDGNLSI